MIFVSDQMAQSSSIPACSDQRHFRRVDAFEDSLFYPRHKSATFFHVAKLRPALHAESAFSLFYNRVIVFCCLVVFLSHNSSDVTALLLFPNLFVYSLGRWATPHRPFLFLFGRRIVRAPMTPRRLMCAFPSSQFPLPSPTIRALTGDDPSFSHLFP